MRHLIDTSLPSSIAICFQHPTLFGSNVYGLAVNIMSTFIHNEPTSLSILQESGLHLLFLSSLTPSLPVSAEVISALPNGKFQVNRLAFGAICLNQVGMDAFIAANPIPLFLSLLISPA